MTAYLKYSSKYNPNYQTGIDTILDTANLFATAREDLDDENWKKLQDKTNVSERVSQMLVVIGEHKIINQAKYKNILPAGYGALYKLCRVENEKLVKLLNSGKINSRTSREQIHILTRGNRPERDDTKSKNTTRFLNVRLAQLENISLKALQDFQSDLESLVSKYKSKIKLEIEDSKQIKNLEKRRTELLKLLERDLKQEKEKKSPDYNSVFKDYKTKLKVFDNETTVTASHIYDKIVGKSKY